MTKLEIQNRSINKSRIILYSLAWPAMVSAMNGWKPANLDKIQQLAFGVTARNEEPAIETDDDEYDARKIHIATFFSMNFQSKVM